jgi:hypothetical protein
MIYELLIVFLIITFSYIFKLSDKIGMDKQLTFICLCFIIIITYKMLMFCRMQNNLSSNRTEFFYDFSKEVNEFISNEIPNNINNKTINEYKEELNSLQEQVGVMNEYLAEISKIAKGEIDSTTTPLDEINIQASQQIQDYRIKKLQDDIAQTTDLIKKAKLRDDAKSFRKIPVYSSCVVSNADGSISIDTPINSNNQQSTSSLENRLTQIMTNPNSTSTSTSTSNILNNSVNNSINNSNNNIIPNNQSSDFSSLLSHIQKNGITLNLDTR